MEIFFNLYKLAFYNTGMIFLQCQKVMSMKKTFNVIDIYHSMHLHTKH